MNGFTRCFGLAVFAVMVSSCGLLPLLGLAAPDYTNPYQVSFDLAGAAAIAATDSGQGRALSVDGVARAGVLENLLLKVLGDGSTAAMMNYQSAYSWDTGPTPSFIRTGTVEGGDAGRVYIGFAGGNAQLKEGYVDIICVFPDNHYQVIWPLDPKENSPSKRGQVGNMGASYMPGMGQDDNPDPFVQAPDGKIYFQVTFDGVSEIFYYDPLNSSAPATKVTPEGAKLSIDNFQVDGAKHLFLQGRNSGGGGSFLRYYTPPAIAANDIYFSSDNSAWVRGYTTAPDDGSFVILNGSNIRKMNGIIKASIASDDTISYKLLFPDAMNTSSWMDLRKWYTQSWGTNATQVIEQLNSDSSSVFAWLDEVKLESVFNWGKFHQRIQVYFAPGTDLTGLTPFDPSELMTKFASYTNPYSSTGFAVNQGQLAEFQYTLDAAGTSMADVIANYPEDFLRAYYPGKQLLKDWLQLYPEFRDLQFSSIGRMFWGSNGLYALSSSMYWGGGSSADVKVIKLVDRDGNSDLKVINLGHAQQTPTLVKINGDYVYYRYDLVDSSGQATGKHGVARKNFALNLADQELLSTAVQSVQVTSYDYSSDNRILYIVGFDNLSNEVFGQRYDMVDQRAESMKNKQKLRNIRVMASGSNIP